MNDTSLLGPWVRRFLLEYAVKERNLARNTQRSYRDTLSLLIPFIANKAGSQVERLKVIDASAERVRHFLLDLEETRGCCVTTRNQRLAAIHALARFIVCIVLSTSNGVEKSEPSPLRKLPSL
ncbi:MAG TPA: site-specific integrase [Pyrinomonadaceae bacterium]|nr:site-specific integrase [Pyrinomonadaceae bacterium]